MNTSGPTDEYLRDVTHINRGKQRFPMSSSLSSEFQIFVPKKAEFDVLQSVSVVRLTIDDLA